MVALTPFSEVLAAFRDGRQVIILDDTDRENEGDLAIATQHLTPEALSFMMREARGLICCSIDAELAAKLDLPLQTVHNASPFNTPFAVSIDAREVAGRGVTAEGRCRTMRRLIEPDAAPGDFASPGHVFPLIANPAGVLGRRGQTEGSYDLARLAGLVPSGVICEILKPDGTMARGEEVTEFGRRHSIPVTSVAEIARYRIEQEVFVRKVAESELNTGNGRWRVLVFEDDVSQREHLALVRGDPESWGEGCVPLVRVHSECLTGDVFTSRRCDCGKQLAGAMEQIGATGQGVILYLRQEGRGIGLLNKLRAYALQDLGRDTVDANLELGFKADERDYAVAARMLEALGTRHVRLLTNNPAKVAGLERFSVAVEERVPLVVPADPYSEGYLAAKRLRLGHLLAS